MRRLSRDVELHERAQRIKAKEERRKTNLKKKDEKLEKEREARRKAGLSEVREQNISPRQQRLGAFLGLGKGKERAEVGQEENANTMENPVQPAPATARGPLRAKSPNGVVQSCVLDSSYTRKEIDLGENDGRPLCSPVTQKQFIPSVPAVNPLVPHQEPHHSQSFIAYRQQSPRHCPRHHGFAAQNDGAYPASSPKYTAETMTNAQVDYATELLGLISTQDLQSSDDDSTLSDTIVADDIDHRDDGDKNDDNDEGGQEEDNDFADVDFEELAQDIGFGPPPPAASDGRQAPNQEEEKPLKTHVALFIDERIMKKPRTPDETKGKADKDKNDTLFDEFAPLSQDLLDLVEKNEFDNFEISTQDIQILDP